MKKLFGLLATAIAGLLFIPLWAQEALPEPLYLTQYTDENGLPQNSVKSIVGDSEGFVWMATENGLVRFDGRNFYLFDRRNLNVKSNRFYVIHPGMEAGTNKRSTAAFTTSDGSNWVRIAGGTAVVDSLHTRNQTGRLPYLNKGYQTTMITLGLPFNIHDANLKYYLIPSAFGNGHFFVCMHDRVDCYDQWKKTGSIRLRIDNFWNLFSLGGQLYQFDANRNVVRLTPGGAEKQKITGDILLDPTYRNQPASMELYWNSPADQAFFYANAKLYRIEPGSNGELVTTLMFEGFNLESRNVKCVYYDEPRKIFYLGSITQGLFVLRKKQFRTLLYPSRDEMDNVFYAQVPHDQNSVITPLGIILGLAPQTNHTIHSRVPFELPHSWDTRGMIRDKKGFLWVKSATRLVVFYPNSTKPIRSWEMGEEIKSIYEDQNGTIWVGLRWAGLYCIRPEARFDPPQLFAKGNFEGISYITQRSAESLWVGTENGLHDVSLRSKKCLLIKGTEKLYIKSIYVRGIDETWLTVADKGIMLISEGKIVQLTSDKNRYLASAHCIFEDRQGFFWITTNKGLFRFSRNDLLGHAMKRFPGAPEEIFYEYYYKNDGFVTNEFNGGCQPCAVRLGNGYVSLPSLKGLVWFRPEVIDSISTPSTSIFFDKAEQSGVEVLIRGDTIRLPSNPKRITLSMATPHFGHPYDLQISYALMEGHAKPTGKDWVPVPGRDVSITFSTLNSGNYTLFVRKINGFGPSNYKIRKMVIIVAPLWYETWWARLSFAVLVLLAIYGYNLLKLKKVRRENRRLELKVAKRTLDLDRTLKDLKTSNNEVNRQLHVLSRLLTSMTHDFQTPLNYINRTSSEIGPMVRKGQYGLVTEIGDVIANSSQNMSNLMKDLLDYTKANVYGKSLVLEDVNLRKLTIAKYEIFKNVIEQKNNRLVNEIPETMTVHSDFQLLAIIIHNLIDNATKFTRDGLIRVKAEQYEEGLRLTVTNNGTPMPQEIVNLFNQENYRSASGTVSGRNTGLGLLIVKEIAALIRVRIRVSQTDTTDFELYFS